MWPYYIILACILASALLNQKKSRIAICIIMTILLSLLMGLRHPDYAGVDTAVYVSDFERLITYRISFGQMFTEYNKDYFYYFSSKLFSLVCPDANMWLLFCAFLYIGSISYLIFKYSRSVWLSYLIFVCWDFYAYNFQLVRHTWSLAFVALAFPFMMEGRIKRYAALMLCAIGSHITSMIIMIHTSSIGNINHNPIYENSSFGRWLRLTYFRRISVQAQTDD